MNLTNKNKQLILLISNYLDNQASLEDLKKFAWEVIEYFSQKKTDLPVYQSFENEFWYAIWQIQHLADEEYENDNTTKKVLGEALDYLKHKKQMPSSYLGRRP